MRIFQAVLAAAATLACSAGTARAEIVYASTTDGRLISFDSAAPGTLLSNVAVSGVDGAVVGIDFRPQDLSLYAVGNSGTSGMDQIYRIDLTTGVATSVATLGVDLTGAFFGVDFNPVANALRIVSDDGQNLRIPFTTLATIVDGALNVGGTTETGIAAAAYTNNVAGATSTVLTDIDTNDPDGLFTQSPANSGNLIDSRPLSQATNGQTDFDISGASGIAYASLNGGSQFGTVNPATGDFTLIDEIGGGFAGQITGMSVQAVPEPAGMALLVGGLLGIAAFRRRQAH